jgi:membrane protein YqaA with SNARE-associated domain|tara:strand:- start:12641 stop:13228 length:588 start_codon:yes stop_codon:yes gene_type:complete
MKWIKQLYNWVLHWADTPYALLALIILAVAESSFFPVPVDILLIALAVSVPMKSFIYASYTSLFSVVGGVLGYVIGLQLMDLIGYPIIEFYGYEDQFKSLSITFQNYNFITILTAALTPIPYKVFTITAGAVGADFWEFLVASAIGRTARFFAVSALIYYFGEKIKFYIEKYFNILTIIFGLLLIGGFVLIKVVF